MSVKQMALVWELDLAPNQRLVLLAYADHADDEGNNIYPSLARIAHKTGYSRDQVRRISRQLAGDNLIERVAEPTHNKGIEYRLTLERGSKLPPLQRRHPSRRGANDPPGVGAPVQPEPSVEPSLNAPKGAAGSEATAPADEEFEGWHIEERLRERLDARGEPYTRERLRRYTRWANALYKRGTSEQELYEAAERVASEWHRVKLTLEDALSDVQEGKQANGKQPVVTDRDKPRSPTWYASLYPVQYATVARWIGEGAKHSEIERRLESGEVA